MLHNFEFLGAIILVACVNRHLPHQELFGVASVFFSRHPSRLVGTLPQEHIAVGSAFRYDASRPLILRGYPETDLAARRDLSDI